MFSFIIVTWNSLGTIKDCLQSIKKYVPSNEIADIVIVDNGSTDGTCEFLAQQSGVTLIRPDSNLGFAKANNLAANVATGKYLILMNPDAFLVQGGIKEFANNLKNDIVIVAPKLVNRDGSLQPSTYMFDSKLNIIMEQFQIGRLLPNKLREKYAPYDLKSMHDFFPEWVIGAFFVMKKDYFLSIKGFSSDYFMYAEDMDICYKVRLDDKKIKFISNFKVMHLGGVSEAQDDSSTKFRKAFKSRMIFEKKFNLPNYSQIFLRCYKLKRLVCLLGGVLSNRSRVKQQKYSKIINDIQEIQSYESSNS